MAIAPKTVFIGPANLSKMLEKHREDLNFVANFPNIGSFYDALDSEELSNDIDVIMTIDKLFDPNGKNDDFEHMIAAYSPYCLMIIVQYNPDMEKVIRERVTSMGSVVEEVGNDEYYFINPKQPNVGIDKAKSSFINNNPNSQVSYTLQGINLEEMENMKDASTSEEKEIPGKDVSVDEFDDTPGNGKIVAITSSKGGVGVTSVTTLLTSYVTYATENAVKENGGKPVNACVVDLNMRNGQLGFVIGALKPSILKLRSDGINSRVLEDTMIYSEGLKADCLLLPQKPTLSEALTIEFIKDTLDFLKKKYDYIFVDAGSSFVGTELDMIEKVLFPMSDLIVYVTDCSSTSLLSMARWIETVKAPKSQDGMNVDVEKIGVVVNDYIEDINIDGDKIAQLSRGLPVITVIPSNRKLAIKATNHQRIQAILRDNSFKEAYERLAKSVIGTDFVLSNKVI